MKVNSIMFPFLFLLLLIGCRQNARFSETELLECKQTAIVHPNDSATCKILFLGDLDFGESYQDSLPVNILKTRGHAYSFRKILPLIKSCDYVVANLETTLAPYSKKNIIHPEKSYLHYADTAKALKYLKQFGIDAVSLANNHTMDFGPEGLKITQNLLKTHNIQQFGAGKNETEAAFPLRIEVNFSKRKRNIYILASMQYYKTYKKKFGFYAGKNKAGVCLTSIIKLIGEIKMIKNIDKDASVIIFPHWGYNYTWKTPRQIRLANMLMHTGTDLIIGHGAHRIQEIEMVNSKPVLYSLGNSVFNSEGRYGKLNSESFSMLTVLELSSENYRLKCYPIVSDNKITDYMPGFLNDSEMNEFIRVMKGKTGSEFDLWSLKGKDSIGNYFIVSSNL